MKEQVEVIIDVHEPEKITQVVDAHDEVSDYKYDSLDAGDLDIEGIGFERKELNDYVNTLKGNATHTLDEQLRKLDQRYEHAYLLIDGDTTETKNVFKTSMPGESIRGSWASLTAREDSGVHAVIPCSNSALLADMAIRLARKHIEKSDHDFIPQPVEDPDISTTAMMYACIPGVGPAMAYKLEEEFPTVESFVNGADYEALQEIEGIGEKTAIKVIDAFV